MTDEQLDAIEARAHVALRGTSPWHDDAVMRSTSDVPALVAEVRRLREGLRQMGRTVDHAPEGGC
jgi:hypothetical protein